MADWRKEMIRERAAYLSQNEASAVLADPSGGLAQSLLAEGLSEQNRLQAFLNAAGQGAVPYPMQGIIAQFNAAQEARHDSAPLFFASAQGGKADLEWLRYVSAYNEQVARREAPVERALTSPEALYQKNHLSAAYWEHDLLAMMMSDPAAARAVIQHARTDNAKHTEAVSETSEDLQKAVDAAEAFKRQAKGNSWLENGMRDVDSGKDPFEMMCASPELEDQLIKYKQLKIEAEQAKVLCGGDCTNPDTNPLILMLREQSKLLQALDEANDGKGDRAAAAKAYGDFVRKNEKVLEALDQGDVKRAMTLTTQPDKETSPSSQFADLATHPDARVSVSALEPKVDLSALATPAAVDPLEVAPSLAVAAPKNRPDFPTPKVL